MEQVEFEKTTDGSKQNAPHIKNSNNFIFSFSTSIVFN